jgi:hypothetical protein
MTVLASGGASRKVEMNSLLVAGFLWKVAYTLRTRPDYSKNEQEIRVIDECAQHVAASAGISYTDVQKLIKEDEPIHMSEIIALSYLTKLQQMQIGG